MRKMRPWQLVIAGGALLVAGCQLVAGVRTDAELDQEGSGGKGCTAPSDCAGGACQDGVCKPAEAKCVLDLDPFDILTPEDLGGHEVDASSLVLASGPGRVFVSVIDKTASRLVIRTVHELRDPVGSRAEFPLADGAAFVTGRESGGQVTLLGRVGSDIGQLVFLTTTDGVSSEGTFQRNESAGANRRDPSLYPGFWRHQTTDRTRSDGMDPTQAQPTVPKLGELALGDSSSRAAVVASLAETLTRAVALGDQEGARVVHEAIGRLLGLPVVPEGRVRPRP
ncbi:hypothetical protein AB3662_06980 [Sorangium cellulosum]|uniref:hypothetical protein n=1 Tax=Sorangium cellulosum TaxID=56 RepID=UPI003D9A29AE